MKILYVFPHPDDESFGPALAIARQWREGHAVHLLTLTRGGATRRRHDLGLTVDEMGAVRRREMDGAAAVLGLAGMTVLDLPDAGLKHLDPRRLEMIVAAHATAVAPDVLVTYAVHGVSGFADHLVTHAVVKRVFCELRERPGGPRRLALFTLLPSEHPDGKFPLATSPPDDVGCAVAAAPEDVATARRALACYTTYAEVIAAADPLGRVGGTVYFELFQERPEPRLDDLTARLPPAAGAAGGR